MLDQYVIVKAIEAITSQPNKSFSVRGLASAIRISPGSSGKALDFMAKKGIVTLKIIGRSYQYRANLESSLCRQWKILFNLDLLADSGFTKEITKKIPGLHSILLYGSFAKGTNDGKSDVDILVIASKKPAKRHGFRSKLKREINLSIISLKEWKVKSEKEKVFYENVIYDSIVLHGTRPVVL
ncbi:MAG: nucleotidyltransferase domain-containing protein [Candidatus Diapherotrites archaeon]